METIDVHALVLDPHAMSSPDGDAIHPLVSTYGGTYVEVSELPRYVLGGRYLLFLRNTDWRYSPVLGDDAYRFERIAGKETLVSTSGRAVTGLGADGIETNTAALTEPVRAASRVAQ